MDSSKKRLLQRVIRRIPARMLRTTLEKWGRLTAPQRQSLDFTQPKLALTEKLVAIFEENGWTVKHITELEMTHVIDNPSLGIWNAYQLLEPEDDVHFVELTQFKEQFKAHLRELVKPVSVKIKKHSDEAIWIRIAWGDHFSEPNHFKPAYVVHHLQTPYVFITGLNLKKKKLLCQALVLATRYQAIKDANLHGRNLDALRDVLMRQYQQVFPTAFPCTLAAVQQPVSNVRIDREQSQLAAARVHMASEAFGCGALPELQSAVYKLETKFKDNANKSMMECEEPFRCFVKFSSSNLLESFRHCASSGIASTPVTPLLSSILQKGRNHFVITDNGP
ncbi:centromere protein N [Takifugu flavidus]|uniref:centromere protein N n=1 Tax=Takifugu flavidus TaxID=433684 RepID=UPI002544BA8C|nr:centromere protein N [Takifugu flavidus]